MQVWQAILTKKVELDSRKLKSTISDSARDLLKVNLYFPSVKALMMPSWPGMLAGALHQVYAVGAWDVSCMVMLCMRSAACICKRLSMQGLPVRRQTSATQPLRHRHCCKLQCTAKLFMASCRASRCRSRMSA